MTPQSLADAGIDMAQIMQLLYGDCDGYGLSTKGRDRTANHTEDFVYGEVTPEVMWQLLQASEAKAGENFYDLGSGTGKPPLLAAIMSDLGKCVGIELFDELHSAAQLALARYRTNILPHVPHKAAQHIEYRCNDFRSEDWSDGDIVFSHCTCFSPALMEAFVAQVNKLKSGARVMTVSKELPSPDVILLQVVPVQMAWGGATVYVYKRM